MLNTLCKNCIFAKPAEQDDHCLFDIPKLIKDHHTVTQKDNYYEIENYQCKYGFNKNIYNENIDKFHNVNLIEYIKQQNIIKFSLAVLLDHNDNNFDDLLMSINKLSIKPYYLSIIAFEHQSKKIKQIIDNNVDVPKWKIHSFLENISTEKALRISFETNKNNYGNFMWILSLKSLVSCVSNDSIQNINYIINVMQKPSHYFKCSSINSNIDGVFINNNNYNVLSKTTKDYTIEQSDNTIIEYYD